jgi:hypothetical protein
MTVAPPAAARATSTMPMPPLAPMTRAVSPDWRRAARSSDSAVRPAAGSPAAGRGPSPAGIRSTMGLSAGTTANSATVPGVSRNMPNTSSPTENRVTPDPSAATVPAQSMPIT